jgi:hypothetical protein
MTATPPTPTHSRSPEWSRMVGASLKHSGTWSTYFNLVETRKTHPDDLSLRGYVEFMRNVVIRDLLSRGKGVESVPQLSADFMEDYSRFALNAQEGYLISLIDGHLTLQKLLKVTPFDPVTTLFTVAKLEHIKAITIPA